jgi:hypothetical protein
MKAVRGKNQIIYKDKFIKITGYLLTETLKARRAWGQLFLPLNENNFHPRKI